MAEDAPATAGDELLSAFKVASFAAFEEDDKTQSEQDQEEETRDWDEIIPENIRLKVEEEEKAKEMEDLYLPPRSRKTLQQINQEDSDGGGRGRKRKKRSDSESGSEEGSDEDRPKKRGRPRKEQIKGFSEAEVRRFVKSYKKFPAPMKRLEAIACDAELQEKPLADLRKLGELLKERCMAGLGELQAQKENENEDSNLSGPGKRRGRGPSIKFGGVSINPRTLLANEDELEPLDSELPADPEERKKWTLGCSTKAAKFDVEWGEAEDSALLRGVYQYGMGSWEAIKMDPSLGISDKILANDDGKPQAKHLDMRAQYLLKILRKRSGTANAKPQAKRKPKAAAKVEPAAKKPTSKEIIEDDSSGDEKPSAAVTNTSSVSENSHTKDTPVKVKSEEPESDKPKPEKKKREKSEKKKTKKKDQGPMHFTANHEPRALDVMGDLEPPVFNKCKELMRPVKKALKALDNPDETLSEHEQLQTTRRHLIQIGDQINKCLANYKDPEQIKEWRSHLWDFVSKFTEYDAKKLYKLYKHAVKKAKPEKDEEKNKNSDAKESSKHKKLKSEEDKTEGQNSGKKSSLPPIPRTKEERKVGEKERSKDKEREKGEKRLKAEGVNTPLAQRNTAGTAAAGGFRGAGDTRPNTNSRPSDNTGERWNNNRYGGGDHKRDRDRFEPYPRMQGPGGNYNRDRDRDRNNRRPPDKPRFHQGMNSGGYGNHYGGPPGYDQSTTVPGPMFQQREHYPGPSNFDWRRDGKDSRAPDYRSRDYERRAQGPSS